MLVKLYKKLGFKAVDSLTSRVAQLYYCFAGIHEDSLYLMIKNF